MKPTAKATTELMLESLSKANVTEAHQILRPVTKDGLIYSLPTSLLQCIHRHVPDFFGIEELEQELRLAEYCSKRHSIGYFVANQKRPFNRIVTYPLLYPPDESIPKACKHTLLESAINMVGDNSLRHAQHIFDDVRERQLAYLGWLLHNQAFLVEKQALEHKYSELVATIDQFPTYPVHHFVQCLQLFHGLRCDDDSLTSCADEFDAFFQKWQIGGLATWDIPRPSSALLGGPSSLAKFVPDPTGPTVKLAGTLRLQARARPEALIRSSVPEHLQDWEKVLENRHPAKLSYSRWSRLFQLAFYCDIVLARNYPDRMKRHAGRLDHAFSVFFGDEDVQAIRKLRSLQRKLHRQSQ